ncbi:MAG: hypothetical protein JWN56_291 [Sphingobacteriales bacterium]|nr:hypothetical protein [Sphingobacteriales bacterium]
MKLSIISINYNHATDLKKTIKSVKNQIWRDFEYIIIDGGSTDESVTVIKQHETDLAYWVSEPDKGVFHAMNKGIEKAKGEYLLMLNAGDYLADSSVLERVFASNLYKEDILFGDVYREAAGKIFQMSHCPDVLTFNLFRNGSLCHQGTFIKKQLHELIDLYDEDLKYSSDWKFFVLAICKYNVSYKHLPFFIAVCDCSGLTCNPNNFLAMKQENEQVLKQYFPAFLHDYMHYEQIKSKSFKNQVSTVWQSSKMLLKNWFLKASLPR